MRKIANLKTLILVSVFLFEIALCNAKEPPPVFFKVKFYYWHSENGPSGVGYLDCNTATGNASLETDFKYGPYLNMYANFGAASVTIGHSGLLDINKPSGASFGRGIVNDYIKIYILGGAHRDYFIETIADGTLQAKGTTSSGGTSPIESLALFDGFFANQYRCSSAGEPNTESFIDYQEFSGTSGGGETIEYLGYTYYWGRFFDDTPKSEAIIYAKDKSGTEEAYGAFDTTFSIRVEILEGNEPVAVIAGPDELCVNEAGHFDGSGSYDRDEGGERIVEYVWTFERPDGSVETIIDANVDYYWSMPGTYDVNLTVTDNEGWTDTEEVSVQVNPFIIYIDDDALPGGDGKSWATAHKYLQDTLAVVDPNHQIWVAQGTYTPDVNSSNPGGPGDRAATFKLINGVRIYGGFSGVGAIDPNKRDPNFYQTILSGDLNGDDEPNFVNYEDNSYHVVTASGVDANTILDGFTITAGNTSGAADNRGGGMLSLSSSPTLINCNFENNAVSQSGGGMYTENGSATLTNCTFMDNRASGTDWGGGGLYNKNSTTTLDNCFFTGNSAGLKGYGGGIYSCCGSSLTVTNSDFLSNSAGQGGGITVSSHGGIARLINCGFYGNYCTYFGIPGYSKGGGLRVSSSDVEVTNCLFSGNSAHSGGGLSANKGNVILTNCTLASNTSLNANGNGIACGAVSSILALDNCILWNDANEIWNDTNSTVTINFSDVQGGWPGVGNININPFFVREPNDGGDGWGDDPCTPGVDEGANDDFGDLRLLRGSPCIDAGDNTAVPADITDLDNDANTTERIPLDLWGTERFLDDPCTIDTGVADLPNYPNVVDIGAYEFDIQNWPVYFVDPNLKAAVEAELGITDPTPTDMLALTYLAADDGGIFDLTGLEYATNLIYLNLRYNQISDISAVSGLTNLTYLNLFSNQISDISAVSGLTNLTVLYLYSNQISDINAVSGLTNLTDLDLYYNQISNINAVSGLMKLTYLDLCYNQISDISAVSGLTNLTSLNLCSNQISDINAVSGLTNLTYIYLCYNQISDISAVSGLTNLTYLDLFSNQITDISAVSGLTNLMSLGLSSNQISDISAVLGLTNLAYLYLSSNQITDIFPVSGLTNLTHLDLHNNQISDISALSGLTNLDNLWLNSNPLNTAAYCTYIPVIESYAIVDYDVNPNQLTVDCSTDFDDFAQFASHWLEADCEQANNWCGWADLNHINGVDFNDLAEFVGLWLAGL